MLHRFITFTKGTRGRSLRSLAALAALCSVSSPGLSQTEPPSGDGNGKIPSDVENTVQVLIVLRNGSTLEGVVKEGRFAEAAEGQRFIRAQDTEGNGLRLWYVGGASGFIFLDWKEIESVEVLLPVTEDDEAALQEEAARKAAEARKLAEESDAVTRRYFEAIRAEKAAEKSDMDVNEAIAGIDEKVGQYYAALDLLKKFPPSAGWGEEKYNQIRNAAIRSLAVFTNPQGVRIVQAQPPNSEEKEFVEVYEDWKQAVKWLEQGLLEDLPPRPASPAATPSGTPPPGPQAPPAPPGAPGSEPPGTEAKEGEGG